MEKIMAAHRKYNWEGLFDRPTTVIERGKDYHCSQSTMAGLIRNKASKLKVRVRLIDTGTSIIIEVLRALSHSNKTTVAG